MVDRNLDFHCADICLTCRKPVSDLSHFSPKLLTCGRCRFRTHCHATLEAHDCGGGADRPTPVWNPRPPILPQAWECSGCGFSTAVGNRLATHLALCRRSGGTAVPKKCDAEETGDLIPDSVLGSLGLGRKSAEKKKKKKRVLEFCEAISPKKLRYKMGDEFEVAPFKKRRRTIRFGGRLSPEEPAIFESDGGLNSAAKIFEKMDELEEKIELHLISLKFVPNAKSFVAMSAEQFRTVEGIDRVMQGSVLPIFSSDPFLAENRSTSIGNRSMSKKMPETEK